MTFDVHFRDDLGFGCVPDRHLGLGEDEVEGAQTKTGCDAGGVKELVEPGTVDFPAIAKGRVRVDDCVEGMGNFSERASVCFENIARNVVHLLSCFVPVGASLFSAGPDSSA